MKILGISAFYHDSAAALIADGKIVAAAQEERFTRKKHDDSFPLNAIEYCLREARVSISDIDFVAFYDKPFLKFERLLESYLNEAPRGFSSFVRAIPVWLKEKLYLKETLKRELTSIFERERERESSSRAQNLDKRAFKKGISDKLLFAEHHQSHLASAFYPSPFKESAILTIDGVGEWATTSLAFGSENKISILKEIHFPHSLGLLYSAFTYYIGFKVNSGEYKVMGLAPYGEPIYANIIKEHLIDIKEDGSFRLNMEYFEYVTGLTMTNERFHKLFGAPPRKRESKLTQRDMNLAASIQAVTEEVMLKLARFAKKATGSKNLALAGGVALNCVANGKILKEGIFEHIFIQPAAGDAGGALGAALAAYHTHLQNKREPSPKDAMCGAYLGIGYTNDEVEETLKKEGAIYHKLTPKELIETTALALSQERVVGWHQGRMEFGPRALGARSILGSAKSKRMQSVMNLKIKYRESFRPFAPSVLRERVSEWFELDCDSPYMLLVAPVKKERCFKMSQDEEQLFGIEKLNVIRSEIPSVTHIDYSARIQTVDKETNPRYHALIERFGELSGVPVVVNTSFNVRGEPIVCSPLDSYRCFMGTEMDMLVIEDFVLYKDEQPLQNREKYKNLKEQYELD